jgi:hypothetical protein
VISVAALVFIVPAKRPWQTLLTPAERIVNSLAADSPVSTVGSTCELNLSCFCVAVILALPLLVKAMPEQPPASPLFEYA